MYLGFGRLLAKDAATDAMLTTLVVVKRTRSRKSKDLKEESARIQIPLRHCISASSIGILKYGNYRYLAHG